MDHDFAYKIFTVRTMHTRTDGHHKLIRWHFVTHCGIDGYSRLVVFIKCSSNNKASTVYDKFLDAVKRYGLPSRVRCDQGGENIHVAQHMIYHVVQKEGQCW